MKCWTCKNAKHKIMYRYHYNPRQTMVLKNITKKTMLQCVINLQIINVMLQVNTWCPFAFWRTVNIVWHCTDGQGFSFSNTMVVCNHWWNPKAKKLFKLNDSPKVKEWLHILRSVLAAVMLRRTKSRLMEYASLVLTTYAETTMLVTCQSAKRVHMSILRKELPKLVALSSGTSNYQSL